MGGHVCPQCRGHSGWVDTCARSVMSVGVCLPGVAVGMWVKALCAFLSTRAADGWGWALPALGGAGRDDVPARPHTGLPPSNVAASGQPFLLEGSSQTESEIAEIAFP